MIGQRYFCRGSGASIGGPSSSAQMISYELSYGMALASVLVVANSLSLTDIVNRQAGAWFGVLSHGG